MAGEVKFAGTPNARLSAVRQATMPKAGFVNIYRIKRHGAEAAEFRNPFQRNN